jgi:hypothetical protein
MLCEAQKPLQSLCAWEIIPPHTLRVLLTHTALLLILTVQMLEKQFVQDFEHSYATHAQGAGMVNWCPPCLHYDIIVPAMLPQRLPCKFDFPGSWCSGGA